MDFFPGLAEFLGQQEDGGDAHSPRDQNADPALGPGGVETVSQRADEADPVVFPERRQLTGPRPHDLDQQREEIAVAGPARDRVDGQGALEKGVGSAVRRTGHDELAGSGAIGDLTGTKRQEVVETGIADAPDDRRLDHVNHSFTIAQGSEGVRGAGKAELFDRDSTRPPPFCLANSPGTRTAAKRSHPRAPAKPEDVGAPVRQANWHKTGGESPPKRRTNHPRFSASRAAALVRVSAKRRQRRVWAELLSIETYMNGGAEAVGAVEGNTGWTGTVRDSRAPRCRRTQARTYVWCRDLGGLHFAPVVEPGPHEKGATRNS